jgi:hypothetical protein
MDEDFSHLKSHEDIFSTITDRKQANRPGTSKIDEISGFSQSVTTNFMAPMSTSETRH